MYIRYLCIRESVLLMHGLLLKFITHYSQGKNSSREDDYILKAFTYQKSLWYVSMQDNDFD